jgi:hypothetical protein
MGEQAQMRFELRIGKREKHEDFFASQKKMLIVGGDGQLKI